LDRKGQKIEKMSFFEENIPDPEVPDPTRATKRENICKMKPFDKYKYWDLLGGLCITNFFGQYG